MQDAAQARALQLLFIELRVGLARSAIQASLIINGAAASAIVLFLAHVLSSPAQGSVGVNVGLLKGAVAVFGTGLFLAGITFVNAYVAQGALASGQSTAFGDAIRRFGLVLIVASLLMFLLGLTLVIAAI
jgi:hypothetical protein